MNFGPYEVIGPLGAGGMGVVYRARDTRLQRDVAIKVLAQAGNDPAAAARLEREARAIASLQHPNICAIHDIGNTDDGQLFLVLELLTGETLQQRLQRGPLPESDAVDIAVAIAGALGVAHGAGFIHRDIKPANIFLTAHGPKLLDFGLAKATATSADGVTVPLVTNEGQIVGTAAYMSPEQLEGQALDGRTDIYSLGITLGEMLTGTRSFTAGRHPGTDACVVRATERARDLRFQTVADFRSALLHVRHSASAAAVPAPALAARPARRKTLTVALASLVAVAVIGGAWYALQPRVPPLTDRDKIVIADFHNTTGDPLFDDALRQGLAVQLQQSPFITVLSDQQVQRTLKMMGRDPASLPADAASEVCKRTSSAAVLEGSIAPLGSRYVLGLKATRCSDDTVIDQEQSQVDRKEDVLHGLGELATAFRRKSGESLASQRRFATPLDEATTSSLEALKAYSAGRRANFVVGPAASIPFLKRAVAIDPNFAVAWSLLGFSHANVLGSSTQSIDAATRSYELRERTTDHERFQIEALYERQVTGNLDRAHQILETWAATYPQDADAHGLLSGFATQGTGRYEQTVAEGEKTVEVDPLHSFGHFNIVNGHIYMDQFTQARSAIQRAIDQGIKGSFLALLHYKLSYLQGEHNLAEALAAAEAGTPDTALPGLHYSSLIAAREGRMTDARAASQRLIAIAQGSDNPSITATYLGTRAIWEALVGNKTEARKAADASLETSDSRDSVYASAFALARIGDSARSMQLAADLERRLPDDTSVRFNYVPTLRALDALRTKQFEKAITILEDARPYERAMPALAFYHDIGASYPVFVRGEVYQAQGKIDEAVAEFQRILSSRGRLQADPIAAVIEAELAALGTATRSH